MRTLLQPFTEYLEATRLFSRPARRFLLATTLGWMAHGVVSVVLNLYLLEAGWREAFVGRVISTNALAMALLALPAGWLADRWGRRRSLVLGALIEGLGMAVRVSFTTPGVVLAASFLAGVGQALYVVAAAPFITEHSTERERTHLFSAFFSVELLAAVLGNMLGGWLPSLLRHAPGGLGLDLLTSYRIALLVGAGLALAAALPMARLTRLAEAPIVHERRSRDPAARALWPIGVNALLLGFGAGLVIPFMNLYFARRFACSSAQIGVFFAAAQITTALAAVLGPALGRRFGKLRTATAMELLSLPFLVTLGAERKLEVAVGLFLVRATLMQAGTPLLNTIIMEALPPALRARSTSLANTVWQSGWALSSSLAGLIIQAWGYAVPFYITAVLYFSGAVSFYLAFRRIVPVAGPAVAVPEALARGEGPGAD